MPHVVFVHGICNKPPADELLAIWRRSLAEDMGLDLGAEGVSSSQVYWADVMYAAPAAVDQANESTGDELVPLEADDDLAWAADLPPAEREWVERMAASTGLDAAPEGPVDEAPPPSDDYGTLERVPLPWFLKRRVMRALLRDVHHYLFDQEHEPRPGERFRVQQEIRARFVAALEAARAQSPDGPLVVLSHSMGTVVAYDCLKRVPGCPGVDALMTVGSPLGLDEVQDKLQPGWSRADGFPRAQVAGRWVNVYDRLDPVAGFDARIANDYMRAGAQVVEDVHEPNWGRWRHDITKYLRGERLRAALRDLLGRG